MSNARSMRSLRAQADCPPACSTSERSSRTTSLSSSIRKPPIIYVFQTGLEADRQLQWRSEAANKHELGDAAVGSCTRRETDRSRACRPCGREYASGRAPSILTKCDQAIPWLGAAPVVWQPGWAKRCTSEVILQRGAAPVCTAQALPPPARWGRRRFSLAYPRCQPLRPRGLAACGAHAACHREQVTQNFIAVPNNHVLSVVPTKYPFGWSGLMPNLFFHQRYPPKIT